MFVNDEFLQAVVNVVKEAGAVIEAIAKDGFETRFKAAQDPVTTADLAANELLHKRLLALLPEAGWLSEETRDSDVRLAKEWVWIVDPIDGTKEFIKRVPNYAVSVALAQNGEVVLGVVYNLARGI